MGPRIALCLTAFLWSGCAHLNAPSVTARNAQLTGASPGGLSVRVVVDLYNPNQVDLAVRALTADVEVAGTFLGTFEQNAETWVLPAQQHTQLEADFLVPFRAAPALLSAAIFAGEIPYRVEGTVDLSGVPFDVPYTYEGTIGRAFLLQTLAR